MNEAIAGAVLGAAGAVVAAAISVLGRGRVSRIEAIARVLKDLPQDSPAFEPLQQVLEEDARELRGAQQSFITFLSVTVLVVFLGSIGIQAYGVQLAAWSSIAYATILVVVLIALVLLFFMYALLAYMAVRKAARYVRSWLASKGKRTR